MLMLRQLLTSHFLPVDVCDVGIGDNDAVPAPFQASHQPQRVQVVLIDDVPDSSLPQQLLPPQPGGRAYVGAEGYVTGLPCRLVLAILQQVTLLIRGHGSGGDHLISSVTWLEKQQIDDKMLLNAKD